VNFVRWTALALTIFIAALIQPVFLSTLNLPGATPDLVLALVCAWAIAKGPMVGSTAGFIAGLFIDLMPPTEPVLGLSSLALVIIGFTVGILGRIPSKSFFRPIIIIVAASIVFILIKAGLTIIFESQIAYSRIGELLITQAIYIGLLSVFVLPLVTWLDRKLGPNLRADEIRI
jgi:rod shape-determining protein MreD